MSTSANANLPLLAMTEFLKRGSYDKHLRRFRKSLVGLNYRFIDGLQTHFPKNIRVTQPQGGYVLWVELPPQVDSLQLYQMALEEKISISPGPIFSSTGEYRNFVRFNYCFEWTPAIDSALEKLGQFVKALM